MTHYLRNPILGFARNASYRPSVVHSAKNKSGSTVLVQTLCLRRKNPSLLLLLHAHYSGYRRFVEGTAQLCLPATDLMKTKEDQTILVLYNTIFDDLFLHWVVSESITSTYMHLLCIRTNRQNHLIFKPMFCNQY